jgi:iron complex transport system ATP-binding protein
MLRWEEIDASRGSRVVLDRVSLTVARGEWLGVLGPNGAGKTSLVRTLADLALAHGRVLIDGRDLGEVSQRERARLVAIVPQHPLIPPGMPVFDYVLLGRTPHHSLRAAPSRHDRVQAQAVMQRLELEAVADRTIDSLSGGERQRAVLARAVAQDAPILVLDEPTTFLDLGHQFDVLELVAELRDERDVTVVTTMHDLSVAGQFVDRVAVLRDGALVASGPPATVLTPDLIEAVWGVAATTSIDERGAVVVTVGRRREAGRRAPSRSLTEQP